MYIFGGIGKLQVYNHLYRLNLEDEEHEWKLIDVGGNIYEKKYIFLIFYFLKRY